MAVRTSRSGLRERKKQRTRQAIVDSSTILFLEQGFQQTTVDQIAEEAEIALSTLFNYFPTKADIVFCLLDAAIDSARRCIAGRPDGEPAIEAIRTWLTEELPSIEQPYAEAIRRIPKIIGSTPQLHAEERLRLALLEDVLAAGFARDLRDSPDGMRPRVLAAIAMRGMLEAWNAWYEKHATDADFQLAQALEAKATHVVRLLETGLTLIEQLPEPEDTAAPARP